MKLLKDLVISRREFQDWDRNLYWGRDGSLYMTTYPEICIGEPIFRKDVENNSKNLFHVKDHVLEYPNKFEFEPSATNSLLNSQPVSHARICKPSPVDNLLAVLTSNLNVLIFKDERLLVNLNESDKALERRSYHSLHWSPNGHQIAIGNEASELVLFTLERKNDDAVISYATQVIPLTKDMKTWVTHISWERDAIVAALDDNSVYVVDVSRDYETERIRPPARFKIVDIKIIGINVLITAAGHFHHLELTTQISNSLKLGPGDEFYIIPLLQDPNCTILISDRTSCKVKFGSELMIVPDHTVSPHLERKFKKWSTISNEFGKYEATMLIHGVALSPDGYSLAIAHSMERVSTRYRIVSERQFNITFIPLFESWKISKKAVGLAWYQTYQIYGGTLPVVDDDTDESLNKQAYDLHMDFKTYIKVFMNDNQLNKLRFFNFIEEKPSIDLFRRAIFEFAVSRKSDLENPLDKASVQSLASVLQVKSPVEADRLQMASDFITESFNFNGNNDPVVILSEQNHIWRRCAITLLPILTTKVKVCPISKQRVIDIKRDTFNNYGWFTKTLLETLDNESVYTGTTMHSC